MSRKSQAVSAIPSIDISNSKERKALVSAELVAAAKEIGFFYVTGEPVLAPAGAVTFLNELASTCDVSAGHGITQADIDDAFAVSRRSA